MALPLSVAFCCIEYFTITSLAYFPVCILSAINAIGMRNAFPAFTGRSWRLKVVQKGLLKVAFLCIYSTATVSISGRSA